jgi:hypothetical protein
MSRLTLLLATIGITTLSGSVAEAHDLYIGTTDPLTHGICCSTSEHDGYGDCDQLVLEPGVLTGVVGGYRLRLTVKQAQRINPMRTVPVDTFIPDSRIQPSMDGNWHVCIPAYEAPTRGDFFCFFRPGAS